MKAKFLLGGMILAAIASACAPTYRPPTVPMAPSYKELPRASTGTWVVARPTENWPQAPWWEIFGDPRLNDLEIRVSSANQNIVGARAQLKEALEEVNIDWDSFFPTLPAAAMVQRSYASQNFTAVQSVYYDNFELYGRPSWIINPFTAYDAYQAAKASAQASAAAYQNTIITMQETLAIDYFNLESTDMQIAVMNESTGDYSQALTLTVNRHRGGVASDADIVQAKAQLEAAEAQLSALSIARAQYEHAIAVLVGESPSSFSLSSGTIAGAPPSIPVSVPSTLLQRRPDIAEAERQMAVANENIGLARAAYFPSLSLTAQGGNKNVSYIDLFTLPSQFWSLGVTATGNLFEFGVRRAEIRQAHAAYDAAVAAYRQTTLSAFQSVEDALSSLSFLAQEESQQDAATQDAEKSVDLEIAMYKGGTVDYLNVIQVQTIMLQDKLSSVLDLSNRMQQAVTLIAALGGGWNSTNLQFPKIKKAVKVKKLK